MYKVCVTPKTAQQQKHLEHTLLRMMQEQPISEITVRALCDKAGFSRNVFYRLFDEKNDVLIALIDHTLMEYPAFSSKTPPFGGQSSMEIFFSFWLAKKPLLDGLRKSGLTSCLLERCLDYVMREDPQTVRHFHAEDPDFGTKIMLYHLSGLMMLVINWHHSDYVQTVSQMAEIAEAILLNPPVIPV